ncbi:MAG: hypothetical protein JSR98_01555 [Proteobacteria bacterium]|nr:hypothetical protein [Pseudomonadota bacterium]
MIATVEVAPAAQGWSVRADHLAEERRFDRGAAAEAAARRIAERLSAAGEAVRLVVRLKDGSVGGRFLFAPRWAGETQAEAA